MLQESLTRDEKVDCGKKRQLEMAEVNLGQA